MASERAPTTRLFVRLVAIWLALVLGPAVHARRCPIDWVPKPNAEVARASAHPAPDVLRAMDRHEPSVARAPFLRRAAEPVLAPGRGGFGFDRNRFAWVGYLPSGSGDVSHRGPRVRRYCLMVSEDPPRA